VTYINTSFFAFYLILILLKRAYAHGFSNTWTAFLDVYNRKPLLAFLISKIGRSSRVKSSDEAYDNNEDQLPTSRLLTEDDSEDPSRLDVGTETSAEGVLDIWETMILSLEFCILWVTFPPRPSH
jgi:hypothetical protein